jgi:mRNA-degrading endonuclease toxin of MazEF toxin-antitoxin module
VIGKFVWAAVPFAEGDGRYKIRPALIINKAVANNGQAFYLVAPRYSAMGKCKGDNEVVMTQHDAVCVGLDHEGVLRLNPEHLAVIQASDIKVTLGHINDLSVEKAEAIRRAARRINCTL